ncbi:MAG TPA: RidA family protein [Bacillota bacterium]|jgi:2-iminobutanoate/2-iminopropanoate deaminase|nr:RidA family protein [Bacillota bacterium]HPZ14984.1 RidA family protein [Bacillota bacterium]
MSRKAANFGALLLMLMMAGEGSAKVPQYFAEPGSAAPFSAAVRAGDFIFASGQIGITANGEIPASIEDQARLAMDNLQQAFKSAGADLSDVVKCTVMLDDMRQWPDFNKVYVSYFKPGHLPARSAFGADGLALGAGVEVECIAYKPLGKG